MRVGLSSLSIYHSQKTTSKRTTSSTGGQGSSYYTASEAPHSDDQGVGIGKTFGKLFKIIGDFWEDMKREIIIGLSIAGTSTWLFLGSRRGRKIVKEIERSQPKRASWNPFTRKAKLNSA